MKDSRTQRTRKLCFSQCTLLYQFFHFSCFLNFFFLHFHDFMAAAEAVHTHETVCALSFCGAAMIIDYCQRVWTSITLVKVTLRYLHKSVCGRARVSAGDCRASDIRVTEQEWRRRTPNCDGKHASGKPGGSSERPARKENRSWMMKTHGFKFSFVTLSKLSLMRYLI